MAELVARPDYREQDLDDLAAQAAEMLVPVYEANDWGRGKAVEIALTVRRMLAQQAADLTSNLLEAGRLGVWRDDEDRLSVILIVGSASPILDVDRG